MKREWQEARPNAQVVIKPVFLEKEIGVKMQVINRENKLLYQTKQTDKDIEEAYRRAMNDCLDKFPDTDLRNIFWYHPYMMDCKDIKVPHYEKTSNCRPD